MSECSVSLSVSIAAKGEKEEEEERMSGESDGEKWTGSRVTR